MISSESELIKQIDLLKSLKGDCSKIEVKLKGICSIINAEWDRDETPSVTSIKNAIDSKLNFYRSKLLELRGE